MSDRQRDKITIAEVAKRAGVSTATAGRVLGDYGYSRQEIKDKVRKAAEELGYRPNLLARSLITGKTKTIGVVAGDIQSPFYASVMRGVSDVTRAAGFGILLTNSDERLDRELEAVQLLREKQVDGLIIAPSDLTGSAHLHATVRDGCPVVLIDRLVRDLAVDGVCVDNHAASRDCIARLVAAGHRRIGLVAELEGWEGGDVEDFLRAVETGSLDSATLFPSWQRLYGYVEALKEARLPVDPALIGRVGTYSAEAAGKETRRLLHMADRPTALFPADGLMAAAAMEAITALHLQIPEDLSLICFDDLDWMSFIRPGIAAVVQPLTDMGEAAARLMLARIAGEDGPPQRLALKPKFAERGSIARPRAVEIPPS
ncbi:alanine racemase [Xaviernesmea oryzae]|uniref:Alanine racemase n=1 Tax=Xaviernesmea oryzae TaxID=464029 RepID=A0A1Q9AWM7_9HYPH|nr:LacI family DNA-binding transcriptional regulator [Xaviernesmea oryzae]OLP59862.1 alanine racemase [Xaviernesmea oryzae]SEK48327.1 transcriptional regulator, LacI family [Xaviernesmea oryzae]